MANEIAKAKFLIIQFKDKNQIEIVPRGWVDMTSGLLDAKVAWPKKNVSRLIKISSSDIDSFVDGYDFFDIKVKKYAESYEIAEGMVSVMKGECLKKTRV